MRVLVTGATGLLGNNLVRASLDAGHQVRALVRKTADPRALQDLPIDAAEGDVRDAESVARAVRDIDAIVHCAAYVRIGYQHPELYDQINVEGTRNIVTQAVASGARLVYVSSVNSLGVGSKQRSADEQWVAAPNVDCPYVQTKQAAEAIVLEATNRGLDAAIIHPGFMLGPWDWKPSSGQMILQVARRFTRFAPKGGASVCDVRDVAAGILSALQQARAGQRYIMAGENISYFDLWTLIAEITGGRRPWFPAGPLMKIIAGRVGDLSGRISGREPEVNTASVKMADLLHYFNSHRAQQELGYRTRTPRQSICDAWQWFQQHGYVTPIRR